MPNMSNSTTSKALASMYKLMTRNIWKKLQSMKTLHLDYGGFKFALKWLIFRWLPQMTAYVPQKLTQSKFLISGIRLICSSLFFWHLYFIEYFFSGILLTSTKWFLIHCRYHLDLCENVFGDGVFPDVDATNLYYGGTKIAGLVTNLCLNFFCYSLFSLNIN